MKKQLLIATEKTILRPLVRNLLRAVALLSERAVQFQYEDEYLKTDDGKIYDNAEQLFKHAETATPETVLSEELVDELAKLLEWLEPGSKQVPVLRDVLEEVRIQSDYRTACEPKPEWEMFWANWSLYYQAPQQFAITGKGKINEVNQSEAEDYLDAHLKSGGDVAYMKNAVESLLATIPLDAEIILDIGSGPGYINGRIPADYSLLAMDIDEEILRYNTRKTCLGDIMDIPLADNSVDLIMACDMLEHLPDEVLKKGAAELERVSRKYIYLQVPFQEDPLHAFAHCPRCGNVWHVNHHKRVFDEQILKSVLSNEWEPVLINYTGELSYRRNGLLESEIAKRIGWKVYNVEGCRCPKCGAESKPKGSSELKLLQRISDYDKNSPFPVYSEIGILFCRKGMTAALQRKKGLVGYNREPLSILPVDAAYRIETVYTRTELLPMLYFSGCRLVESGERFVLRKDSDQESAWVAVAFPSMQESSHSRIEIIGHLNKSGAVGVGLMDGQGDEQFCQLLNWSSHDQIYQISLSKQACVQPIFLKLYFQSDELFLNDCRITGGKSNCALAYYDKIASFLSFHEDETEIRLYSPAGESFFLSHKPNEWRKQTNQLHERMEKTLSRFYRDLDRILDVDERTRDQRNLIEQWLLVEVPETAISKEEADQRSLIAQELLVNLSEPTHDEKENDQRSLIAQDLLSAPAIEREAVSELSDAGAKNRKVLANSLCMESELCIFQERPLDSFRKKLRMRQYSFLKQRKDNLRKWMHQHERLYETLIDLGFKSSYQKLKRRILR